MNWYLYCAIFDDSSNYIGEYHTLIHELRRERPEDFLAYFRMSPEQFDYILKLVGQQITKKSTKMRLPIPADERLAVTLRWDTLLSP